MLAIEYLANNQSLLLGSLVDQTGRVVAVPRSPA